MQKMTTSTTTPTSTNQDATSKSKGKLLTNLRDDLEEARVLNGVPGMSVAVMHKGEVIFAEGFGLRNAKDVFTADVNIKYRTFKVASVPFFGLRDRIYL